MSFKPFTRVCEHLVCAAFPRAHQEIKLKRQSTTNVPFTTVEILRAIIQPLDSKSLLNIAMMNITKVADEESSIKFKRL